MKTKRKIRKIEIVTKGEYCHKDCNYFEDIRGREFCILFRNKLLSVEGNKGKIHILRCPPCL